jgi:hypothetical protein
LARCGWLTYVTSSRYQRPPGSNQLPVLPPEYKIYYQHLVENYSETDFYKWIIKECKSFKAYAR